MGREAGRARRPALPGETAQHQEEGALPHEARTDGTTPHDPRQEAFEPPYPDPDPALEAGAGAVDQERVAAAVRELLLAIGEDPDREGLQGTPGRVARAWAEMFAGLHQDPGEVLGTTFDIGHSEMVLVKDIPFYSTCEHHLVPFHGHAHVGYIPGHDGAVTGLSKLARLVDLYARRPQVQERLTTQIVDAIVEHLAPAGVIVVVECEHLCMSMRGVRKPGAKTVTSAVRGQLRETATRAEAMSLILGR
ncbi:GTP cyclohydrolase I [Kocuria flava]|uniref:GTP cyclohydrolase 1 n=1 Tax=Kocuria flava TaxID=446860 RepID=A0A2N4SYD3_9MICC|nr:GTP cyclohydrolase I [Kocuria flava]